MPICWTIDAQRGFVTAKTIGNVSRQDLERFIEAVAKAGAYAYPKLFDASASFTTMEDAEVLALAIRFKTIGLSEKLGSLAVVLPTYGGSRIARLLGVLATAKRPMRIFHDIRAARRWIKQYLQSQ